MLVSLYLFGNSHPNRVSIYTQKFDEINSDGFDFSNGFRCSNVHEFEKVNKFSVSIFGLNFHQDENNWKHKLIPTDVSKNMSDKSFDLSVYKNHSVLNKNYSYF